MRKSVKRAFASSRDLSRARFSASASGVKKRSLIWAEFSLMSSGKVLAPVAPATFWSAVCASLPSQSRKSAARAGSWYPVRGSMTGKVEGSPPSSSQTRAMTLRRMYSRSAHSGMPANIRIEASRATWEARTRG